MFLDGSLVESATTGEVVNRASALVESGLKMARELAKNGGSVEKNEKSYEGGTYQERIYRDIRGAERARCRGMFEEASGDGVRILEQDLISVQGDRLAVTYLSDGSRVVEVYDQPTDRMLRLEPGGENTVSVTTTVERMFLNLNK